MIFKRKIARFLNLFTDKPINEKALTVIDILITIIGILVGTIGILMALQLDLLISIIIVFSGLGIFAIILVVVLFRKTSKKSSEISPYTPWTPVTPPQFVGRERLLRQLAQALEKQESLSLIGDRRIGKTSVLKTWQQKIASENQVVMFVTGENEEAISLREFVNRITGQQIPDNVEKTANILSEWANEISAKTGAPPLVLVDEAERIIENLPARFFERLRGMLGRVVWIFASREYIDLIYKQYHKKTSPFENRLSVKHLGLLENEAAEQIIAWGQFSEEIQDIMRLWAGRHPFFLQLLGRCFFDSKNEAIQAILDEFQTESASKLRRIWSVLSEDEKVELKQCLTGKLATKRSLRVRGLVTEEGRLFGKILETWLEELN